ncbi:MAG: hypothetical protein IKT52_13505 [Oscillospiraceae bacterium]|nr:hypothetical protein [Oscillospiraceae bacterium]
MIKLYFLEWENGLVKAGFTYNGKRYLSLVTSQNRARFVRSGAAITRNLEQHQLSEAQSAAVDAFITSNDFAVEYTAPIL